MELRYNLASKAFSSVYAGDFCQLSLYQALERGQILKSLLNITSAGWMYVPFRKHGFISTALIHASTVYNATV